MAKGQQRDAIIKSQNNMAPSEHNYHTTASPGYATINEAQENDTESNLTR